MPGEADSMFENKHFAVDLSGTMEENERLLSEIKGERENSSSSSPRAPEYEDFPFPFPYLARTPLVGIEEPPDDTGSEELEIRSKRLGTVKGVLVPTCEFMWSVIIFLMFGHIVGRAGLLLSWLAIALCATISGLTVTSASAIATNKSRPPKGGMYEILSGSLGSGVGGGISIMYYLGVATLTCVEVVGSIRGLISVTDCNLMGKGQYVDQIVLSLGTLLLCAAPVLAGKSVVSTLSLFFMVYLLISFASMFLGLLAATAISDNIDGVTGLSLQTMFENLWPNYFEEDGSEIQSFSDVIVLIMPCFIGIYSGINAAHNLKNPFRSIPRGGLYAVVLSFSLYTLLTGLIASTIRRTLLNGDLTIVPSIAWPYPWIAQSGIFLVGVGAAIHCLSVAGTVLWSLAREDVCPRLVAVAVGAREGKGYFNKSTREERENTGGEGVGLTGEKKKTKGTPRRAVIFTVLLVIPLLFLPDLETLAGVVTMAFLLCYLLTNLACFLVNRFSKHNWRPAFRWLYQGIASIAGTMLCLFVMFYISWIASICALCILAGIAYWVQMNSATRKHGHGVHGLLLHIALNHLQHSEKAAYEAATLKSGLAVTRTESLKIVPPPCPSLSQLSSSAVTGAQLLAMPPADMIYSRIWRPQVLVLVNTKGRERRKKDKAKSNAGPGAPFGTSSGGPSASGVKLPGPTPSGSPSELLTANPLPPSSMSFDLHQPSHPRLLSFVSQLTSRGGLVMVASVVTHLEEEMGESEVQRAASNDGNRPQEGLAHTPAAFSGRGPGYERQQARDEVLARRRLALWEAMEQEEVEGFLKVFTAPSVAVGYSALMQTVGLGELTPNTVVARWPDTPRLISSQQSISIYTPISNPSTNEKFTKRRAMSRGALRELQILWSTTRRTGWSSCLCKGLDTFPQNNDTMKGCIDVWWVVPDGQLLLLIASILQNHYAWRECPIRLLMVARTRDDPETLKSSLQRHLELLRIRVQEVIIVTVPATLSAPSGMADTGGEPSETRDHNLDEAGYALSRELSREVAQHQNRNQRFSERTRPTSYDAPEERYSADSYFQAGATETKDLQDEVIVTDSIAASTSENGEETEIENDGDIETDEQGDDEGIGKKFGPIISNIQPRPSTPRLRPYHIPLNADGSRQDQYSETSETEAPKAHALFRPGDAPLHGILTASNSVRMEESEQNRGTSDKLNHEERHIQFANQNPTDLHATWALEQQQNNPDGTENPAPFSSQQGIRKRKFKNPLKKPEGGTLPTPQRKVPTMRRKRPRRSLFEHAIMVSHLKFEMKRFSSNSALVLLNLPPPDTDQQIVQSESGAHRAAMYVDLVDAVTEDVPRCVLVHTGERARDALSLKNL